jgi:ribosomal-protein-alanine N-acetyltransferase
VNFRLNTERMSLREIAESDIDFIAKMWAEPCMMLDYPSTLTREQTEIYVRHTIKKYQKDGIAPWLALDRATDEPLGVTGIMMQTVHDEIFPEIGYAFWKDYWRQGLATEAACAMRDFAFQELNQPVAVSLIPPRNAPSFGVAKKVGMLPWKTSVHSMVAHIVFRVDKSGETSWQDTSLLHPIISE